MRTADDFLTDCCNWAADRPWSLCLILCGCILIGCAVDRVLA